ncbi:hypothetical protein D3C81_2042490 [compost metagenome]
MAEKIPINSTLAKVITTVLRKETKKFICSITSEKCPKLSEVGKENGLSRICPLVLNELTSIRKNGNTNRTKNTVSSR